MENLPRGDGCGRIKYRTNDCDIHGIYIQRRENIKISIRVSFIEEIVAFYDHRENGIGITWKSNKVGITRCRVYTVDGMKKDGEKETTTQPDRLESILTRVGTKKQRRSNEEASASIRRREISETLA